MSGTHIEQSQKYLIFKIVTTQSKIDKIYEKQPQIFSQILKVFSIGQSRQNIEALHKLKQRIINICLQQKQQYLQYLYLPKFRLVSQHALELLKQTMEQIAILIKKQLKQAELNHINNQLNKYIPKFNNLNEIENYHLRILELYSSSYLCPMTQELMQNFKNQAFYVKNNQNQRNDYSQLHYGNFHNNQRQEKQEPYFQNYQSSSISQINQRNKKIRQGYQNFNNVQGNPLFSNFARSSEYLQNKIPQDYQFNSFRTFKQPENVPKHRMSKNSSKNSKKQRSQVIEDDSLSIAVKKQKISDVSRIIQDYSQPVSQISQNKKSISLIDPYFKNCVCKGKIQKIATNQFYCESCNFKYHFDCLKLDMQENQVKRKRCPICQTQELRNILYELVRPPLLQGWIVYENEKQGSGHFIKFSPDLIFNLKDSIINSNNYRIQIRLIAIKNPIKKQPIKRQKQKCIKSSSALSKRSSHEIEDQQSSQNMKPQQKQNPNNKRQQISQDSKQKFNSIHLSKNIIQALPSNKQCKIPINLATSKDNGQSIVKQLVIYYGIYQFKLRSYSQIVKSFELDSSYSQKKEISKCSQIQSDRLIKEMIMKSKSEQIILEHNKLNSQISKQKRQIQDKQQSQVAQQENIDFKFKIITNKNTNNKRKQENHYIPIRFSHCHNLTHVIQLRNYTQNYLRLRTKNKRNYIQTFEPNKVNPNTVLYCPFCVEQNKEETKNNSIHESRMYVDWKLYRKINNDEINISLNSNSQQGINSMEEQQDEDIQQEWIPKNLHIDLRYRISNKIQQQKEKIQEQEQTAYSNIQYEYAIIQKNDESDYAQSQVEVQQKQENKQNQPSQQEQLNGQKIKQNNFQIQNQQLNIQEYIQNSQKQQNAQTKAYLQKIHDQNNSLQNIKQTVNKQQPQMPMQVQNQKNQNYPEQKMLQQGQVQ